VTTALIVELYRQLPRRRKGESEASWSARLRSATEAFAEAVRQRYTEGTLQRLLNGDSVTRQAATLALGLLGTLDSNAPLAARLHDPDEDVRELASDALWGIWFRGNDPEQAEELRRLLRLRDRARLLAALDAFIEKAPGFAEAINQRAIVHFQLKQYERSIADCERVLLLNPYHFGAQVGMAQCYLQLRKNRAALKAFRNALRLHPTLEGVEETIRALEKTLGEEERREEK